MEHAVLPLPPSSESASAPGDCESAEEIWALADAYRRAGHTVLTSGSHKANLSHAPARLLFLHAIELYINGWLRHRGQSASDIRRLGHDTGKRAETAEVLTLDLRKRTLLHLRSLSERREYLSTRYNPARRAEWSHINRLIATAEELAEKVTQRAQAANQKR